MKIIFKGLKCKWKVGDSETESLILSTFASPVLDHEGPWAEPDQELVLIWLVCDPVC